MSLISKILGAKGENQAESYLKKKGLKILQKNYSTKLGEIDLICFDKKSKEYVFVEVKSRSSTEFGSPSEAVNFKKQHKIRNVASLYLKLNKLTEEKIRFDVVEVLDDKINHIEYAF